ncbi:Limonene-1,2-epoxide hydrolase [Hartmannibacter diazotrophicus]|uniref:Limonene-1,2-epoxide hydrolase n=1 Tax=Hartmannibacter diazotrophicus TaxID=1482074 RepID=A0A2C9D0Q7_9HYPH|nr:ester cyclase [Hartmannibacter diazotrophicus]SON53779.1 Limonene-1,2-epoxide hydrolase [Hartmannibacter diazotrophicus]
MTEGSPTDLVDAFYRAYNAQDAAAATALYAQDGWHQEGDSGPRRDGQAALQQGLERFFVMLPDAHWLVRETVTCGGTVAVVYTLTGRLGIDIGGSPTRGKPIELAGIHMFQLGENSIAGTRDYWDIREFQRQIKGENA